MDKHEFIGGMPRSGKTTFCKKKIRNSNKKVLFIDIKAVERLGKVLTENNTFGEFKHSIKNYKNVTFHPSNDIDIANQQLDAMLEYLLENNDKINIDVYIDEVIDYIPQGKSKSMIYNVCRRGLVDNKTGVRLILIGHNPAEIDKRAIKYTEKITLFKLSSFEYDYLKRKKLPADDIKKLLVPAQKYSRVEIENGEVNLIEPIKL